MTPEPTVASALTTDRIHLPNATFSRVTPKTRDRAAKKGEAMKDGSFPIRDAADLKRAIAAFGRAKDKGACKRHIMRRAKALGKTDLLPESWKALALAEPAFETNPAPAPVAVVASAAPTLVDDELLVKADRHNAQAPDDRIVSVAKLKTVYRRGLASYTSKPCVTPEQYAHARVNSFLRLLASGAPDSASYTADNDLLPRSHPASMTS